MYAVVATLILLSGVQDQPRTQSLLQRVVPNPTGTNGYEDYLRAADIMTDPNVGNYINWTPHQYEDYLDSFKPSEGMTAEEKAALQSMRPDPIRVASLKRLDGMTFLEVRREAKSKYGKALDLLRQAAQKRVWDPRQKQDYKTLYPEFAYMKSLAKFAEISAFVAFADGKSHEGARILLDAFELGYNLQSGNLISNLVGTAIQAIVLAGFEKYLPSLSYVDALTIESRIPEMLAGTPRIQLSLQQEFKFGVETFAALLDHPDDLTVEGYVGVGEDNALTAKLLNQLKTMPPERKAALVDQVRQRYQVHVAQMEARFSGPEANWVVPDETQDEGEATEGKIDTPEKLVRFWSTDSVPVFTQAGVAAARNRTQLRLLGLHASVIRYKWENGRMPKALDEAVAAKDLKDPLNGGRFEYETQGAWAFRIYSRGTPAIGEIGLKYSRPMGVGGGGDVPPALFLKATISRS